MPRGLFLTIFAWSLLAGGNAKPVPPLPGLVFVVDTPPGRTPANLTSGCDSLVRPLVSVFPGAHVARADSIDTGPDLAGPAPRLGCRLTATGHDSLAWRHLDGLYAEVAALAWAGAAHYEACGPSGEMVGVHRGGTSCVISGSWDGGDDEDSTYVRGDDFVVTVTCAPTTTVDTTPWLPTPAGGVRAN